MVKIWECGSFSFSLDERSLAKKLFLVHLFLLLLIAVGLVIVLPHPDLSHEK
jgi:hypothetical protein